MRHCGAAIGRFYGPMFLWPFTRACRLWKAWWFRGLALVFGCGTATFGLRARNRREGGRVLAVAVAHVSLGASWVLRSAVLRSPCCLCRPTGGGHPLDFAPVLPIVVNCSCIARAVVAEQTSSASLRLRLAGALLPCNTKYRALCPVWAVPGSSLAQLPM